eukprot:6477844-Amphidinium_carterae.1
MQSQRSHWSSTSLQLRTFMHYLNRLSSSAPRNRSRQSVPLPDTSCRCGLSFRALCTACRVVTHFCAAQHKPCPTARERHWFNGQRADAYLMMIMMAGSIRSTAARASLFLCSLGTILSSRSRPASPVRDN